MSNFDIVMPSPIGTLGIKCQQTKLIKIDILTSSFPAFVARSALKEIQQSLEAYFKEAKVINVDFLLEGTPFQRRVWQTLITIPCGEQRTYGELAALLNTSPRAIGMACRTNPLPIVIPCHRVVAVNHIGGYCGATQGKILAIKEWLLAHEHHHSS